MQIQKAGPIETHNLMLSTFLPSNQIKYSSFVKIDAPKSIIRQNIEHKFLTGLIAATTNTLKLYTLYQNAIALQVGSWRMHEDIKGVIGWDKIIIVTIGQKLAGFKYQGGMLKNAFLISLQFLPIDDQDNCTIYADRLGYYLVIYIKNYLVLCFSQTLATKYRSRVLERTKMELVSQDMRWNEPGKNYILDVVKLKLIDVQINKIEQIQIMDETIYFIGHKNKEKILYFIHAYYFFNSIQSSHAISIVPQKDQLPPNSKFIVFHPHHGPRLNANRQPEFIYQNMENGVITLKSQHMTMDVGKFDGDFQIFHHHGQNLFPLLIWEKEKGLLSLIQKQKTFQQNYDFKIRPIENDKPIDTLIYRQGVIMIASRSGLYLLNIINSVGLPTKIHHSLGSIIDFHIGKDMLIIQNSQKKQTKLYQLTKGPRIDPKPFVTHKKKMFLESLSDLIAIYSFVIGKKKLQILAVKRGTGSNKMFTFYREGLIQFQKILQDIKEYQQLNINSEKLLLVQTKADKTEVLTYNQQGGFNSQQLQWFGWKRQKRWCQLQYIISYDDKILSFFHILTKKQINFELIKSQTNFINIFINFRKITIDRNLKDHQFVQVYFVYGKKLEIYTLDLTIQQKYLVHVSDSIHQGSPILSNELMYPGIHQTDLYRSHTCPQYNMNQHGLRFLAVKANSVISAYLYHNKNDTYLIFITSEQFILIYKKYFNPEDGGFIFRRKITPLNLIKNFKWSGEKSFMNLGQGIVKFGNLLIYKGQIVQSIITRSLFRMEGSLWGLLSEGKIRMIHLGSEVYEGFCIRQIQTGITEELMGIQSTSQYYCVYSRKGFEIFSKDYVSHWRFTLGNETIVCLRMFEHYIGMSYYDYYSDQQGINDYNSIRFRFRIYNCATKNKIIEREKPLDEPILHIRFMSPDKLILVTSSLIFVNILKNDKSLQLFRTHNFSSKRSFLSSFAYIPDILPPSFGAQGSPCFMLFGGSHGGLGFFVGKWIQQEKLKEQWFEGFRCGIRQVTFFRFGEEREELLKSLIADQDGNLIVLTLKVDQAQKIADIRLGGLVNSFKTKSGSEKVIYCSMSDGSIKLMTAIKLDGSEVTYMDFQKTFCEQLPFYGGFNLRASRKLQQKYRSSKIVSKGNVLDGDILEAFFSLTEALKAYILQTSDMELGPIKSIITF